MTKPTLASSVRRGLRRLWRDERGVEAIEFIFVAPVLLILTIGTLEMGLVLFEYHLAGEATRRGARVAVIEEPIASMEDLKSTAVTCDGSSASVTCTGATVEDSASFTAVYDAMHAILPGLARTSVRVAYAPSTVASDTTEGIVTPLVTVQIVNYVHEFSVLGFIPGVPTSITLPSFATTLIAPSRSIPVS